MKRKQVCIAGNDMGCLSTYGEREKLIVFGIAAGDYLHINIDPLRLSGQRGQKAPDVFFIDVAAEPLSIKDLEKLSQSCKRGRMVPRRRTWSTTMRGFDPGASNALTKTLVSST